MVSCQRNLMQIGAALGLYDQSQGSLPYVPELGSAEAAQAGSPLEALLVELGLPDFSELTDTTSRAAETSGLDPGAAACARLHLRERSTAIAGVFPAPVSYRATTGDAADGRNGAFARAGTSALRRSRRPTARATRPGSPNGSSATTGPNTPRGSTMPSRPARSRPRAAPRQRPPPGGRRGRLVARQQLAIHPLQPCLDPGRRALVHRRRPPLGLHGRLERSRGRGQRPLLRSQRADLHSSVEPKIWRAWATVPEAPRTHRPHPSRPEMRLQVPREGRLGGSQGRHPGSASPARRKTLAPARRALPAGRSARLHPDRTFRT